MICGHAIFKVVGDSISIKGHHFIETSSDWPGRMPLWKMRGKKKLSFYVFGSGKEMSSRRW